MIPLEDRLRAAAQVITEVIPEGSAPPLRLAEPRSRPPGAGQRGRRPWADRMAPLASAAAVILVAAASVTLTHGWPGSGGRVKPGPAGTPPYYVSLAAYTSPDSAPAADATVRSTATGSVLARVAPPRPYSGFTVVTGAADDSTFVLGAEKAVPRYPTSNAAGGYETLPPPSVASPAAGMLITEAAHSVVAVTVQEIAFTQFFMLRLDSGASSPRLTMLPMAPETMPVAGAALSPDGRQLAVALSPPGRLEIRVTDLVTYATRTWQGRTWARSWPDGQSDRAGAASLITLSWAADNRTLAFGWPGPVSPQAGHPVPHTLSVSVLNTTAPGTDLVADSTAAPPGGYLIGCGGNAVLTGDGSTIVASGLRPVKSAAKTGRAPDWQAAGAEYSARSGVLGWQLRIPHWTILDPVPRMLWTNSTGSVLIISASVVTSQARSGGSHISTVVGVLTRDRFTQLPGLRAPITSVNTNPAGIAW